MTPLLTYLTGFGLAGGAGTRASIAVIVLGLFHHTPYFELSAEWRWIASPAVLAVLAVLVVVEWAVDAHPELGRVADLAGYLPKIVAGFLVFAAATGTVDESLMELARSGLLGGGTAAGVHWVRNRFRRPLRDHLEELHESVGKAASLGEVGVATAVSAASIVVPTVALAILALALAGSAWLGRRLEGRRRPCVHCGEPIRPRALVCKRCGREQRRAA